jgi:hypothetical protein
MIFRLLKTASSFVLASKAPSPYPSREKSCRGSSEWEGENWYASGIFFGYGLAGNRFEQPLSFLFRLCPS